MMKEKVIVIMNETHSMMSEQEEILIEKYGQYEILPVPANGWTLKEMDFHISQIWKEYMSKNGCMTVIFISPIPYMIKELAILSSELSSFDIRVFHNDKREKKELPNGKIIQVVAKTGWQLV